MISHLVLNNNQPLRQRRFENQHFVLGDIIDSSAKIFTIGQEEKKKFVVVGANDGMIHFMDYNNP